MARGFFLLLAVFLAGCASSQVPKPMGAPEDTASPQQVGTSAVRPVGVTLWTEIVVGDPFGMGQAASVEHAFNLLRPPRSRPMTRYSLDPNKADNDAYRLVIAINPNLNATPAHVCVGQITTRPRVSFQPFTALAVLCRGEEAKYQAKRTIIMPLDPYDPTYGLLLRDVMDTLFPAGDEVR